MLIIKLITTKPLKGILIFLEWDERGDHWETFGGQNRGGKFKSIIQIKIYYSTFERFSFYLSIYYYLFIFNLSNLSKFLLTIFFLSEINYRLFTLYNLFILKNKFIRTLKTNILQIQTDIQFNTLIFFIIIIFKSLIYCNISQNNQI